MSDSARAGTGRLVAVNVVYRVRPGYRRATAIDKRPVRGPVEVTERGLAGDDQRYHGGPDKAVYAYAEDAAWWAERLERPIPPGTLGENLRLVGTDVSAARIGELWRIGEVLEVRSPRTPCANLSLHMGIPRFHQRFARSGGVGAYLSVRRAGTVAAGARLIQECCPDHAVSVAAWTKPTPEGAVALVDSGIDLANDVRQQAERVLARAAAQ